MAKDLLPSKDTQPAEWYTRVIQLAELADYGPVRGTMIIKPYGYAIWEQIQRVMDERIKSKGVSNVYFPLFIPMSFLEKEKNHVEGFAPELAVVTHGGGEQLEESLAVRPTSETVMYNTFANWIQSWRDLPLQVNQWCNVVRWEKRTLPFLRTSEFLWQEGHTAHATHEEATGMQGWAMDMYADLYRTYFAMDGYVGSKSSSERFAGADSTLTFEALMPSGKALQSCTSHDLGQNFSKTFGIKFQADDGSEQNVWQTSWGFSTRSIGGLILAHGDNNGLVLPPELAPIQIVIVPVQPDADLLNYCKDIEGTLKAAGHRVQVDTRDDERFGYKLNKWEVKGVPLIIKIGQQEVDSKQVTTKKRVDGQETSVSFDTVAEEIGRLLDEIQKQMLARSTDFQTTNTHDAQNYDEFKEILAKDGGFVRVFWKDNAVQEAQIKTDTKAVSRCRIAVGQSGNNFMDGSPADEIWLFAKSY